MKKTNLKLKPVPEPRKLLKLAKLALIVSAFHMMFDEVLSVGAA